MPAYVRTHPLTIDRIADMQDRARTVQQNRVPSSLEFYLIKARARVEQSGSSSGLFDLRNIFESNSKQAAPEKQMEGFYGLALVAQKQGRFEQAEDFLQKARAVAQNVLAPGSPIQRQSLSFDYTASELALARGKAEDALQFAQNAAKADPYSFSAVVARVRADLKLGRTSDAITLLRTKTKAQPNETIWWELLARAYDQDKKIGLRHYALAEKFATEGAWPSAIEQLRIARTAIGTDFYLGSVIDARLRAFQNQYREEQNEKRKG